MATQDWCEVLGIEPPCLETVKDHRRANTYAMLLVALLERGVAMTLTDVAARFEEAGLARQDQALLSLQRCRPARPPIYRDGDLYALDPHDDNLALWLFRLGLRQAIIPRLRLVRAPLPPLPGPGVPLTAGELDQAWEGVSVSNWSAQRLVLAVLDAHGSPLPPAEVVGHVAARTEWHQLTENAAKFKRRGCPVVVLDDGRWAIAEDAQDALEGVRSAVRERVEIVRQRDAAKPDPSVQAANREVVARRRDARRRELAEMRRVLLVGFPAKAPRALAMLDVGAHEISTFVDAEIEKAKERLAHYEIIGAQDVRALLKAIGFDPGAQRLAELGPAQKTKRLNKSGRKLKITTKLLVQGSCGISRPFGDRKKLAAYLAGDQLTKLRRRLESDVKSLHALYEYGRLHGVVRLRWGFLDETIKAPWVHWDEEKLYALKRKALEDGRLIEVVVGSAPGWEDPWSRARRAHAEKDPSGWGPQLWDENGFGILDLEVQRARLL